VRRRAQAQAQRHSAQGVCSLGHDGLIGWSVAIPTLLGAALGLWLDRHYPGRHAWTLALLVAGSRSAAQCVALVANEDKAMQRNRRMPMNEVCCWR